MKAKALNPYKGQANGRDAGFTLLDVVLAIAVFAVGMLALVQLQGNIARGSADANLRTGAAAVAEELVEKIRGYRYVLADPDNGVWDYVELQGNVLNDTVQRCVGDSCVDYDRTVTITHFWWDDANDTFIRTASAEPPEGLEYLAYADFKLLQLDVGWDNSDSFYVSESEAEGESVTADLGSGSITIYEIIPSSPPNLGARVASETDGDGGPMITYIPGENPDIVALTLDGPGEKFKESTSPTPDVIRTDELAETWFDVVTYAGSSDAVFLRREEFVAVSCECTLQQADTATEGGFRPTLWNGYDYTEGEFVQKDFGTSANNQQSVFCDTCCRDHHDGGSGEYDTSEVERLVYDPWDAPDAAPTGDHTHYGWQRQGRDVVLAPVGYGDTYVEACRLIRKDGFFRVAQDFNQNALFGFPEDYLDNTSEVAAYSEYVIEAVTDFVDNPLDGFKLPGNAALDAPFLVPASSGSDDPVETAPTTLPTALGNNAQQLRSRGIYVDYLTDELRENISDCESGADSCVMPGFSVAQEMYPFFEVQLTMLSEWADEPIDNPVDVTNEPIADNNVHSRGFAERQENASASQSRIEIQSHVGNLGFTGTDPITTDDQNLAGDRYNATSLYINTPLDGTPVPVNGHAVSGSITSLVGGVQARDVNLTYSEAQCNRTATGFTCIVPNLTTATLTVSGYNKANTTLYACHFGGLLGAAGSQQAPNDNWANFTITPTGDVADANIVIQDEPCGG